MESFLVQGKLELKMGEEQRTSMKVGSQIIEHLSKGIYSNPAKAIKELISNSFDADATRVIIRAKPELDYFSIQDNGIGMNYEDFNEKFLFISRSDKRDLGDLTPIFKRPIIGKIGIGFVAVSQICDEMIVISSKKGEDFKFEAKIDFSKFREIEYKHKEFYELSDVRLKNLPEETDSHYTIVVLNKLTAEFRDHLLDKDIEEAGIRPLDLDGLPFDKIVHEIINKSITYGSQFDLSKKLGRYWQILLEIALTVPVRYLEDGPIKIINKEKWPNESLEILEKIKRRVEEFNFSVDFDGVELKKPILLPTDPRIREYGKDFEVFSINEKKTLAEGTSLSFSGYIYNQRSSIYPPQWRGIVIRIKNTAVGGPDPSFLEYLYGDRLFFSWTFGEIYVDEGLEEAMNINRSSFTTTHRHYQELRRCLHELLHKKIFPRCRRRYEERKTKQEVGLRRLRKEKYSRVLNTTFGKPFQIVWIEDKHKPPVFFDFGNDKVVINQNNPIFRKVKKQKRVLLEDLLVLIYVAYYQAQGNAEKMFRYLLGQLKEWYR